jgi:hypothetical protein
LVVSCTSGSPGWSVIYIYFMSFDYGLRIGLSELSVYMLIFSSHILRCDGCPKAKGRMMMTLLSMTSSESKNQDTTFGTSGKKHNVRNRVTEIDDFYKCLIWCKTKFLCSRVCCSNNRKTKRQYRFWRNLHQVWEKLFGAWF